MRSLDLDWIVADLTYLKSIDEIIGKVREVHQKKNAVREHLQKKIPSVKASIQRIFTNPQGGYIIY